MVSISAGNLVRFVERCSFCGWIDGAALDGWAENAIKLSITERAQTIAVAAGTQPFAFVQMGEKDLTLEDVIIQALGAASVAWESPENAGRPDSDRAQQIFMRLRGEIIRFMNIERRLVVKSVNDQAREAMRAEIYDKLKAWAAVNMPQSSYRALLRQIEAIQVEAEKGF
jgi:hypothetical protein